MTYNKHKRIYPKFRHGTAPWKEGEYYIEQYAGDKTYSVFHRISGYFSIKDGVVPSQVEGFLYGKTLRECKVYLTELIQKMYKE
jgi:hypothetical protein